MEYLLKIKNKFDEKKLILILITTFISGYIVHGQMIFNKLMYHDEPGCLSGIVGNPGIGRWAIWLIVKTWSHFFDITSTNTFGCFFTFLIIALIVYLLLDLFEIKNKFIIVIVSVLSVTCITVSTAFGYMHYTIYVFLSTLFSVFACYFLVNIDNCVGIALSSISLMFALGLYQSCIIFYVNLLLFYYIKNIDKFTIKKVIQALIPFIFALVTYIVIFKLYYFLKQAEPSSYKNISNLGMTDIFSYIQRAKDAFINFYVPAKLKPYSMYPVKCRYFYILFLICLYFLLILHIRKNFSKLDTFHKVSIIVLFLSIPFVVNGMFIVAGEDQVYSMNFYNYILVFFLFFSLIDISNKKFNIFICLSFALVFMIIFSQFKYIDVCYTNLFLKMEHEKSYGLTLISRIEGLDDYSDDMYMCFVEDPDPYFHRCDNNFEYDVSFNDIVSTPPYAGLTDGESTAYNSYSDYVFQKVLNGFNPKRINYTDFGHTDEIEKMPIYPKAGSIKVIDNVIVIKMQDLFK